MYAPWLLTIVLTAASEATVPSSPHLLLAKPAWLAQAKMLVQVGDESVKPAYAALIATADAALNAGPFSVTSKTMTPPSGDKHDYMSVGPYWWPDPSKPDGLPYIRRDGEVNPERNNFDNAAMGDMSGRVQTLALAYYLSGDERYAEHAARLLRVWFLDADTRMNPNLNFGQAIPGKCDGRAVGIIDTAGLPRLVDAILLLAGSPHWTEADQQGLVDWFGAYLDWLRENVYGRMEAMTHNNHGVWYDVQVMSFALFAGKADVARAVAELSKERRIAEQIQPDGSQPAELARTKSFSYSLYNLEAFFELAQLAEHVDVDLWNYKTEDGRSIRKALDWLVDNAIGKTKDEWTYQQITSFDPAELASFLRRAALIYDEPRYEAIRTELVGNAPSTDGNIFFYPPPRAKN